MTRIYELRRCNYLISHGIRGLFVKIFPFILSNKYGRGGELAHAKYLDINHFLLNHYISGHIVFVLVSTK
jgi:hypothetical protein